MRKSMKKAIGNTIRDLHDIGIKTSFTKRDLNDLGVEIEDVKIEPEDIQHIRARMKMSQAVFANVLNVSLSAVRKWEQGVRPPTGSTKVLFEVLEKKPHVLDYRIPKKVLQNN